MKARWEARELVRFQVLGADLDLPQRLLGGSSQAFWQGCKGLCGELLGLLEELFDPVAVVPRNGFQRVEEKRAILLSVWSG